MAETWYYVVDGARKGPHTEAEMRQLAAAGTITPDTLVWNDSMGADWIRAGDVPGMLAAPTPAPLPAYSVPPPLDEASALRRRASVIAPVDTAWKRMVEILFRPFSMGKWFALGVTAWLATLGQGAGGGGGGSGSSNMGGGDSGGFPSSDEIGQTYSEHVAPFFQEYGQLVVWGIVGIVLVAIIATVIVLWLQSRGRFMFLDNVVNNRAEVKEPWRVFAQHAGSLFRWSLVYSLLCLFIVAMLLAGTVLGIVIPAFKAGSILGVIPMIVMLAIMWLVFSIVVGFISRFLEDFVVPVMYRHDLTCTEAWGRVVPLIKANFWRFVLYGIFYGILGAATGIAVMLLVLVTCCTAACLLMIPVVNAVVLLPVTVFLRCYSLDYLAQYGPQFEMMLDDGEDAILPVAVE